MFEATFSIGHPVLELWWESEAQVSFRYAAFKMIAAAASQEKSGCFTVEKLPMLHHNCCCFYTVIISVSTSK